MSFDIDRGNVRFLGRGLEYIPQETVATYNLQQDVACSKGLTLLLLPACDGTLCHQRRHSRHHNSLSLQRPMNPYETSRSFSIRTHETVVINHVNSHRLFPCPYAARAADTFDKPNALMNQMELEKVSLVFIRDGKLGRLNLVGQQQKLKINLRSVNL